MTPTIPYSDIRGRITVFGEYLFLPFPCTRKISSSRPARAAENPAASPVTHAVCNFRPRRCAQGLQDSARSLPWSPHTAACPLPGTKKHPGGQKENARTLKPLLAAKPPPSLLTARRPEPGELPIADLTRPPCSPLPG
ncbi:hypothetical protein NDU88_007544 [Pleurodeles waltl]|uniref:Uncharacterized protein n=1 Tax=Pleurodeles waltl TaxID=8319 RepID=A0AAV7NY99_PLEWA|nr:hypothetical protein NDU88_007544 [Pleurodeles waltl]